MTVRLRQIIAKINASNNQGRTHVLMYTIPAPLLLRLSILLLGECGSVIIWLLQSTKTVQLININNPILWYCCTCINFSQPTIQEEGAQLAELNNCTFLHVLVSSEIERFHKIREEDRRVREIRERGHGHMISAQGGRRGYPKSRCSKET